MKKSNEAKTKAIKWLESKVKKHEREAAKHGYDLSFDRQIASETAAIELDKVIKYIRRNFK